MSCGAVIEIWCVLSLLVLELWRDRENLLLSLAIGDFDLDRAAVVLCLKREIEVPRL